MPLPEAVDSQDLLRFYKTLYTRARDKVRKSYPELERQAEDRLHSQDESNQATISYNLAMTTRRMMLCPRRSETAMISDSSVILENSSDPVDSQEATPAYCRTMPASSDSLAKDTRTGINTRTTASQKGPIAFNGTILAATLMVKTEEEWNVLKGPHGPRLLEGILEQVGLPVTREEGNSSLEHLTMS